jgi:hypothetical protein
MRDDTTEQMKAPLPRAVGQPMQHNGVQPRIAQYDFKVRPRGWIAGHERLNVLFESVKSHSRFNPLENRLPYYILYGLSGVLKSDDAPGRGNMPHPGERLKYRMPE